MPGWFTLLLLLAFPADSGSSADNAFRAEPDTRADIIVLGRVTEAGGTTRLAGAQVVIIGTRLGALTGADGSYLLPVPGTMRGKTVRVQAQLVGYTSAERHVRLDADTLVVDFALGHQTVALREMVAGGRAADKVHGTVAPAPSAGWHRYDPHNTESYALINENGFRSARAEPLSTFSIDVDRASYSNVRRFIRERKQPPKDAVRIEEMINYFPYDYPEPRGNQPFSITTEVAAAPWQPAHRLVRIGLQTKKLETKALPPSNLVFLIDVSGSMMPANKLPLLKQSLRLLVNELRPVDRVAIVVYAGRAGLVLPSTSGVEKERILDVLENLEAGGSTAGGAGRAAFHVLDRCRPGILQQRPPVHPGA